MRGTKRVCESCATRFYDLGRDPIVCPACGAHLTPEVLPEPATRAAGFTDKTGWRGRRPTRPDPEAEGDAVSGPELDPSESADDQQAPAPNDDIVLEEEPDEADISDLLGHDEPDSKER